MTKRSAQADYPDGDVFAKLFSNVTPLSAHGRVIHPAPRRKPIPEQRRRDERAALVDSLSDHIAWDLGVEAGEELVYRRDGLSPQTLKKLRRGHWVVQAELDLHGHDAKLGSKSVLPRRLGDRRQTFVELQRYENACDGFNVLIALVLEITRTIACQRSTSVFPHARRRALK